MQLFSENSHFNDLASLMATKKLYEEFSNSVLVKDDCKKLVGDSELSRKVVYERIFFRCKAGPERKTQSRGIRKSSTIKKDCPVVVSLF